MIGEARDAGSHPRVCTEMRSKSRAGEGGVRKEVHGQLPPVAGRREKQGRETLGRA